jgi:DNA repair protein RadC
MSGRAPEADERALIASGKVQPGKPLSEDDLLFDPAPLAIAVVQTDATLDAVEERSTFPILAGEALVPTPPSTPRATDSPSSTPPDALDHRARVRARFERLGAEGFDDVELLELVLFRSIPRRDTKPIAKALLKRFGSFGAAMNASAALLREIDGVGETVAFDLRVLSAVAKAVARAELPRKDSLLGSWDRVLAHVRATLAHETREQFRVLFLNKKNALIADEVQQRGTIDHTPVYPREIVRRALELSASALILVHNHPSGDPSPSTADIEMTHRIVEVARGLEISVHDHLIIGRNGYVSLKAEGLM